MNSNRPCLIPPLAGRPPVSGISPTPAPGVNDDVDDTHAAPSPPGSTAPPASRRLLDRLRGEIRVRQYSIRTEDAHVDWARRLILFRGKRHPAQLGAAEVGAFLTHLAVERNASPSTQNQAKAALLFLYRLVLGIEPPWLDEIVATKDTRRLPVVLTTAEVRALLHPLDGTMGLVASLLYGTGMRLLEGLRLRRGVAARRAGGEVAKSRPAGPAATTTASAVATIGVAPGLAVLRVTIDDVRLQPKDLSHEVVQHRLDLSNPGEEDGLFACLSNLLKRLNGNLCE